MKISIKSIQRVDIPQSSIKISCKKAKLEGFGYYPVISDFELTGNYDPSYRILLKVKKNNLQKSKDCGTIGQLQKPNATFLRDFAALEDTSFRFFIQLVCPSTKQIKASMKSPKNIDVDGKQNKDDSPLGIKFSNIDPLPWKLTISPGEKPVIEITEKIVYQNKFQSNKIFLNAIIPSVIEEVLKYMISEKDREEEDWFQDWNKLAKDLKIDSIDSVDDDNQAEWIENFKEKFFTKQKDFFHDALINEVNNINE